MRKAALAGALTILCAASLAHAVVPRKWELRTREDFLRGKFEGISLSSDGTIVLAPREETTAGPAEEFYLSFLPGPDGDAFIGTGHGGKVYRIGRDGKSELYFQAPEMDVTCLARDAKGVLYAGTSPNGKIYRIVAAGKGEPFFDPGEKYIWDLLFAESGSLLAAVGETGGIYEITPQGEGRSLLKAGENHILCLRRNAGGEILAGSGGGGLIYRLRSGRASVLYESDYEEVRSLAFDTAGNIYAAASGTRAKKDGGAAAAEAEPDAPVRIDAGVSVVVSASGAAAVQEAPAQAAAPQSPGSGAAAGPGAVFKIGPDGVARRLWSSSEEMVYSLAFEEERGRLLFGTGPQGRIYALEADEKLSLLTQSGAEQAYLLHPVETRVHVLANNPATLSVLHPEQRFEGEYVSMTLDTKTVSSWGRVSWDAEASDGATVQVQTRSGNTGEPGTGWSDWSPPYQRGEEQILSPRARFLQFRVLMKTPSGRNSPALRRLTLFHLQTNIAPRFARLEFLKPNEVYLKLPPQEDVVLGLERTAATGMDGSERPLISRKVERAGYRTAQWEAADENGDALVYAIAIRRDGETSWRTIQDEWAESYFAFDTRTFPDGVYYLRLSAADRPSNPAGTELSGEKISVPFVIDNSLPVVSGFTARRTGTGLELAFQAEDAFSPIEEVQYLVRPDEWRVVFPADGMCDSRTEAFKFAVTLPDGADGLITVRVRDAHGNIGIHRQAF